MRIRMNVPIDGRDSVGAYRFEAGAETDRFPAARARKLVRVGLASWAEFQMTAQGGGWYQIVGRGIEQAEKVRGQVAALERLEQLAAS
jgi:hypothetical protein